MLEYYEVSTTLVSRETHPANPFAFMRIGYARCRMIIDEGRSPDLLYLDVNEAYEKLTGLKNLTGLSMREVLPGIAELHPEFIEKHKKAVESGIADQFELYLKPLHKWFDISVYSPQKGECVSLFDDITIPAASIPGV